MGMRNYSRASKNQGAEIIFRPAIFGDLSTLVAIAVDTRFMAGLDASYSPNAIHTAFTEACEANGREVLFYVACVGKTIAGFGIARRKPGLSEAEVEVGVSTAFWRQGLGRLMLSVLAVEANRIDLHALASRHLISNIMSTNMVRRFGFQPTGDIGSYVKYRFELTPTIVAHHLSKFCVEPNIQK